MLLVSGRMLVGGNFVCGSLSFSTRPVLLAGIRWNSMSHILAASHACAVRIEGIVSFLRVAATKRLRMDSGGIARSSTFISFQLKCSGHSRRTILRAHSNVQHFISISGDQQFDPNSSFNSIKFKFTLNGFNGKFKIFRWQRWFKDKSLTNFSQIKPRKTWTSKIFSLTDVRPFVAPRCRVHRRQFNLRPPCAVRSAVSRPSDSPVENWKLDFNSKQIKQFKFKTLEFTYTRPSGDGEPSLGRFVNYQNHLI